MSLQIPQTMKAIRYNKIKDYELVTIPVPTPKADEVLIKVKSCGICGTDLHIHDGDFESRMPVVTGHETSGEVVAIGSNVTGFAIGERVTGDNSELCGHCHFCREGKLLFCENFVAHGVHLNGGFAEYCIFPAAKLFHFSVCSWEEASLFEAAACAVHGLDRLLPRPGSTALLLGIGPTSICLAQLLKLNGVQKLVVAARAGDKMNLGKNLTVADEYLELDRNNEELNSQKWADLQTKYPHGFDNVIDATGDPRMLNLAIDFCTKSGKVMFYGAYAPEEMIEVSPGKIFRDEITILGSFSQMWCLPRAIEYLQSRKVDVRGVVTHTFPLEKFGDALDAMRTKKCIKATIIP
ncbi:NADP-dependent mannitol dehydrogenase [Lindgomyces ingoldianus]|uniref:NADP-dependent mannitol dehydrogenase n=1 Tax=Lindgomyces ingoldianus TaxID=673940 RepID=A0ACB6QHZ1_9PLEO|nr:NADP-dependent mannitol dehydrogenase [Lindgomyces ingoldianus]KAF2466624.1 NADP-dependent mannitol dehydrogenase [Lindgomyces ingoldianus]